MVGYIDCDMPVRYIGPVQQFAAVCKCKITPVLLLHVTQPLRHVENASCYNKNFLCKT